jgi:hypothetical protein
MSWKDTLARVTGAQHAALTATQQVQKELTAAREAIAAKRGELQRQGELLPPQSELIAHAERLVDETAAAYGGDHTHTFLASLAGRMLPGYLSGRDTTVAPRPQLPFEASAPLPFAATCFLFPRETKAAFRAAVLAQHYEAGVPSADRGPLLARLSRELAELETIEEGLVDAMAANGIVVAHRPEVVQRRDREARAAELKAKRRADQEWLEQARRDGHLGTPRVYHAKIGGVEMRSERRT